jgi:RNA polymerase sigma factor (TIGR02999 family)
MTPLLYEELRRLARRRLRGERPDHTLQPTALVHEVYLRLLNQHAADWTNRAQVLGLAATMMRRILVNHARERKAAKRGGGKRITLSLAGTLPVEDREAPVVDILDLHEALDRLALIDARKSRVVELKFFGGMTTEEMAEVLQVSPATVEREWSFARAWLYAETADRAVPPDTPRETD